ncbi:homoprotocatechuate degradation regulator HpaR [Martelella radicis]|uniref:Homoprotocatechuate degradation regulator HpaR n=1 Tax=Martelella radicis TaxID=1397476 RepID=A0A7W6KL44_9HYPH|nr:homoprotocatechuate degradation regulator HpaR [Martelella radicis]
MANENRAEGATRETPVYYDGFQLAETRRTLPIALLRSREAVMELFRPMLRKYDVTEQQWRVIRVLFEAGSLDASKLAEAACVLPPSLTRILKALETRSLIVVSKDPADRRHTIVQLSDEGKALIRTASKDSVAIYNEIEALLGRDRIQALLNDLEFVLDTLSERAKSEDGPGAAA